MQGDLGTPSNRFASPRKGRRSLRIVKARGLAHDLDEHGIVITAKGAAIASDPW